MSETIRAAFLFLISTVFDLFLFVLIIRLILAWVRANYYQPITQFVVKCTDFLVQPLRKVVPNYKQLETATLILIFLVEIIKFSLISLLTLGLFRLNGLFILAFADVLKLIIQVFFYGIIAQAILSWFMPYSPYQATLTQFTSPIMRPFQRLVPPVGGFDISPIPALIILQLLIIILVNPLTSFGIGVAFG